MGWKGRFTSFFDFDLTIPFFWIGHTQLAALESMTSTISCTSSTPRSPPILPGSMSALRTCFFCCSSSSRSFSSCPCTFSVFCSYSIDQLVLREFHSTCLAALHEVNWTRRVVLHECCWSRSLFLEFYWTRRAALHEFHWPCVGALLEFFNSSLNNACV